ncbi:hypothetical protein JB92DRAFT_3097884 [Gautieria morchelliformis]|nr:hypothetical protein JB92DRAFT_3097884 [Gautieria morchelliformis]
MAQARRNLIRTLRSRPKVIHHCYPAQTEPIRILSHGTMKMASMWYLITLHKHSKAAPFRNFKHYGAMSRLLAIERRPNPLIPPDHTRKQQRTSTSRNSKRNYSALGFDGWSPDVEPFDGEDGAWNNTKSPVSMQLAFSPNWSNSGPKWVLSGNSRSRPRHVRMHTKHGGYGARVAGVGAAARNITAK